MKKETAIDWLKTAVAVIFGNALYALTVKVFLLPAGLITGGTTGIALAVYHAWGVPIAPFVLAFNVVMLAAGYFFLGKQFAMTTVASTFLYPVFLEVFDRLLGSFVLTEDLLMATLFSGLGIGIPLGFVIRSGASTGGMDIPPLVLQKRFRIPVSWSLYVFDVCILIAQAFFNRADAILYGITLVMVYTIVLNKILLLGTGRIEVKIISKHSEEIRKAILTEIDRGVTVLHGEGGYLQKPQQILLSIISNRELYQVEKLAHAIDEEAFVIVSNVSEVSGRGFSMKKRYY